MKIEYDTAKNEVNISKHGVSFERVMELDWRNVVSQLDKRKEYGEVRILSYGMINGRLYTLVWTSRNSNIRPISFRKANKKEKNKYEKRTTIH
ncbi:MAG: BrnT family toxin [Pseudomonadota bacterium]